MGFASRSCPRMSIIRPSRPPPARVLCRESTTQRTFARARAETPSEPCRIELRAVAEPRPLQALLDRPRRARVAALPVDLHGPHIAPIRCSGCEPGLRETPPRLHRDHPYANARRRETGAPGSTRTAAPSTRVGPRRPLPARTPRAVAKSPCDCAMRSVDHAPCNAQHLLRRHASRGQGPRSPPSARYAGRIRGRLRLRAFGVALRRECERRARSATSPARRARHPPGLATRERSRAR